MAERMRRAVAVPLVLLAFIVARSATAGPHARNHGRRLKPYFALDWAPVRMTFRGLRMWATAELDLLRLRLFHPRPQRGTGQGEGTAESPLRPVGPEPEKAATK